jgi:hypothetical protein
MYKCIIFILTFDMLSFNTCQLEWNVKADFSLITITIRCIIQFVLGQQVKEIV